MKKKGRKRVQREPSAASVREMPEFDFAKAKTFGRGPKALERALALGRAQAGLGRPKKGSPSVATTTRSIRFTDGTWAELEREAKKRRTTLHGLLREIIASWLNQAA